MCVTPAKGRRSMWALKHVACKVCGLTVRVQGAILMKQDESQGEPTCWETGSPTRAATTKTHGNLPSKSCVRPDLEKKPEKWQNKYLNSLVWDGEKNTAKYSLKYHKLTPNLFISSMGFQLKSKQYVFKRETQLSAFKLQMEQEMHKNSQDNSAVENEWKRSDSASWVQRYKD